MECKENLERQINAWQERRNQSASRVNWHFTTKDARVKLHKLYPGDTTGIDHYLPLRQVNQNSHVEKPVPVLVAALSCVATL